MDEEGEFWGNGGEDEDEGDEDEGDVGDVEYAGAGEDSDEDDDNFEIRWYVSDMVAFSDRFIDLEETGDSCTGVD